MAIQAQTYPQNLGYPLAIIPPDFMDSNTLADDGAVFSFDQFCFNPPPQHHSIIPQYFRQNININHPQQKNSMSFPQNFAAEFEKQIIEIDRIICLQNERLRLGLQEQRKQQMALILRKYESKKQFLLKQKEEEISKALNKTMELEETLRRIEMEKQAWQSVAREKEAMVMSLNNTIEQLRESACLQNGVVLEDAESCCENAEDDDDNEQTLRFCNQGQNSKREMLCKSCNSGISSVVFLPCRHLSSCEACEAFLDSCPLCMTIKKGSIQALL